MRGAGLDRRDQAGPLLVGRVLGVGAEGGIGPVERVALAASVPKGALLDEATDLLDSLHAELAGEERVEHCDGVPPSLSLIAVL